MYGRFHDVPNMPRWINVDDKTARDTWTGNTIRLTCNDKHTPEVRNRCAMEVVDALNRIYNADYSR